jgi:RNA-directed DNA polymerase
MKKVQMKMSVGSLRDLEFRLGVKRNELHELLKHRRSLYHPFLVEKKPHPYPGKVRRVCDSGPLRYREIDNPVKQLKEIQRRIVDRILAGAELPNYMFGAVPGKSVALHACEHVKGQSSTIVRLDIKSFYPSITCGHVYKVWRTVLGCSPPVSRLLTELTTHDYRLPQGAPTSPAIANLLLALILTPVQEIARNKGITITTWVDDIVISGIESRELIEPVRKIIAANGFKIAPSKRVIMRSRSEKAVTGVRLGRFGPRAPYRKMSEIRAGIYRLASGRVPPDEIRKYLRNVVGRIAHVCLLSPVDGEKLSAYGAKLGVDLRRPLLKLL